MFSLSLLIGSVLRVQQPNIFCTGLVSVASVCVFCRFSTPKNGSSPAALHLLKVLYGFQSICKQTCKQMVRSTLYISMYLLIFGQFHP